MAWYDTLILPKREMTAKNWKLYFTHACSNNLINKELSLGLECLYYRRSHKMLHQFLKDKEDVRDKVKINIKFKVKNRLHQH